MKSDGRRQGIMDFLMDAGTATVDDLASRFGVSKMTVHRDLDELEESGFLRKVRGGAYSTSQSQGEACEFDFDIAGAGFFNNDVGFRCCSDSDPAL